MKTLGKIVSGAAVAALIPLSAMALEQESHVEKGDDITAGRADTQQELILSKPVMEPAQMKAQTRDFDAFLAGATEVDSPLDRTNVMSTDNQVVGFVTKVYDMPVGPDYAMVETYPDEETYKTKILVPVDKVNEKGNIVLPADRDQIRQALIPDSSDRPNGELADG